MMNPVSFDESTNKYLCGTKQYERVTKVLKLFQVPFNRELISMKMAMRQALPWEYQECDCRCRDGWDR